MQPGIYIASLVDDHIIELSGELFYWRVGFWQNFEVFNPEYDNDTGRIF